MYIDEVIKKFSGYHPITKEDEEVFNIAIDCMKFTRDFLPLNARQKLVLCIFLCLL